MDKYFKLPARKTCAWKGCDHSTTKRDEIKIPFNGKTLLLSLCPSCLKQLNQQPNKKKKTLSFQSFSGNRYQYVQSIYPTKEPTKEQHEQHEQLQCG